MDFCYKMWNSVIMCCLVGGMLPHASGMQKITGLMLACKHGHDEVVKKLLEIPSLNINAQDSQR